MTPDPRTLERNAGLLVADEIMRMDRIRHLPVLDEEGRVVGVVSQRDLFRGALSRVLGYGTHAQDKVMGALLVKEVMTDSPETIAPDAPIEEAARLMVERKIGCLPVVEGERLVGILTEADFVATFTGRDD